MVYSKINIKTQEQFIAFANAMALRPPEGPGQYVKAFSTLTEDCTDNNFTPDKATFERYFTIILKFCPNLKSIDVEDFKGHHVVYKAISKERENGGCTALESISYPDDYNPNDMYWYGYAVWSIRDKLKELLVSDNYDIPHLNFGGSQDASSQLIPYTHLKKVQFFVDDGVTSLFEIFSAIRDCNSLEHYVYLKLIINGSTSIINNSKKSIQLDKRHDNIKLLRLERVICHERLVQYLTNTFT